MQKKSIFSQVPFLFSCIFFLLSLSLISYIIHAAVEDLSTEKVESEGKMEEISTEKPVSEPIISEKVIKPAPKDLQEMHTESIPPAVQEKEKKEIQEVKSTEVSVAAPVGSKKQEETFEESLDIISSVTAPQEKRLEELDETSTESVLEKEKSSKKTNMKADNFCETLCKKVCTGLYQEHEVGLA